MQKKKLFLSLFTLCSIVGMGITSCNNQGEQGPIGPEGPQGPEGPAGENGEDGQDGSLILTGEGKPEYTLGKDSDIYIDSTTGDLYRKESGSWTLVMNIKGEDGEDGSNGSSGSDGQDGETARSNTVLPSEGGYVLPSIGSGIENSPISFNIYPNEGNILKSFSLNGIEIPLTELEVVDNHYVYETTIPVGGYVVSSIFENDTKTNVWYDGILYSTAKFNLDGSLNLNESTKNESSPVFEGGDGVNKPLVVSNETTISDDQVKSLSNGLSYTFEVKESNEVNTSFDSILNTLVSNNIVIDTLNIEVSSNASLNLSKAYLPKLNELNIVGSQDATSKIIKTRSEDVKDASSYIFSFVYDENFLDDNLKINLENISFEANTINQMSSFINVKGFNNIDFTMNHVNYKSNTNGQIYGLQFVDNKRGSINISHSNIDLGSDEGLKKSMYPINLQGNDGINVNIDNTVIRGWCSLYCKDTNDVININNSIFNCVNNSSDSYYSFGSIVFDSVNSPSENNKVIVKNTEFNFTNTENYGGLRIASFGTGAKNNYLELNNNSYNAEGNPLNYPLFNILDPSNTYKVIDNENVYEFGPEFFDIDISIVNDGTNTTYTINFNQDVKPVEFVWWIDYYNTYDVADPTSNTLVIPNSEGKSITELFVRFETNMKIDSNVDSYVLIDFYISDYLDK